MYIIILNYCTSQTIISKIDDNTNVEQYLKDNGHNEDETSYMLTENLHLTINI